MTHIPGELFQRHNVACTSDRDAARDAVTEIFLPHRLSLLERRVPLDMCLNAIELGSVTLGYLRYGRDVHIVSQQVTQYHVNVPLTGVTESRTGGRAPVQATSRTAAVFMPELTADVRWRADCAQLCVMVNRGDLEDELEKLMAHPVGKPLDFAPGMDLTTPSARSWLDVLGLVHREAERKGSLLDHPLVAQNLQHLVIHGLLLGQPHNYTGAIAAARTAPPRAVRQAVDLMRGHPERAWSSAELARAVAVSVRSLQQAFRDSLGTSPMAYLRQVRLARVRADLLAAAPETATVTQIAGRWGFVHLGRFSAAYRAKFGESPSRTLRTDGPAAVPVRGAA